MPVFKLVNLNVHSAHFQTVPFKISWAAGAPKFLFISLSPAHNNIFGVFACCAWFCIVRSLAGCLVYLSSATALGGCRFLHQYVLTSGKISVCNFYRHRKLGGGNMLTVASCEGYLASMRANRLKPKAHVIVRNVTIE